MTPDEHRRLRASLRRHGIRVDGFRHELERDDSVDPHVRRAQHEAAKRGLLVRNGCGRVRCLR